MSQLLRLAVTWLDGEKSTATFYVLVTSLLGLESAFRLIYTVILQFPKIVQNFCIFILLLMKMCI